MCTLLLVEGVVLLLSVLLVLSLMVLMWSFQELLREMLGLVKTHYAQPGYQKGVSAPETNQSIKLKLLGQEEEMFLAL